MRTEEEIRTGLSILRGLAGSEQAVTIFEWILNDPPTPPDQPSPVDPVTADYVRSLERDLKAARDLIAEKDKGLAAKDAQMAEVIRKARTGQL